MKTITTLERKKKMNPIDLETQNSDYMKLYDKLFSSVYDESNYKQIVNSNPKWFYFLK